MNTKSKYIKISEYAEIMNVHYRTVWNKFKAGIIKGIQEPETKTIYIENPYYEGKHNSSVTPRVMLYARVSSTTNKGSLEGQIARMEAYSIARGYQIIGIKKEIASGLNENRRQLQSILKNKEFDILLVEHKDRLTRFGSSYIEQALENNGQKLEIINAIEKSDNELLDDFVSIVTSFCGRIYGRKRKAKTEEIIKTITENKK